MASGSDASEKILSMFGTLPAAFGNPMPSMNALDLLVGLACGLLLRLAVYLRGRTRRNTATGTSTEPRVGAQPKNYGLTSIPCSKTTSSSRRRKGSTMNSRPKDPKTARNKNVLIVGGSGSGKTRFIIKPSLMQCHSSYVVTDPKGQLVLETGRLLERAGVRDSGAEHPSTSPSPCTTTPLCTSTAKRHSQARDLPHHQHHRARQKWRRVLGERRKASVHGAHRLHPTTKPRPPSRTSARCWRCSTAWRYARTMRNSRTAWIC